MHRVFRERESILRISFFREPRLAAVGVEIKGIDGSNVCFRNALILVEGYFSNLACDKVAKLGLVHGLALLHAEDMRRQDFIRLVVVHDDLFLNYFVIGKYCHK
jgi:hypothetical protein